MIIKCVDNGGELILSEREGLRKRDGSEYFMVTLKGPSLLATTKVYAWNPFNDSLENFLAKLAENWRGWEGEKSWGSTDGELSLNFTSDSTGHVAILIRLYNVWSVEHSLKIYGPQLEELVKQAQTFFAT